MQSFTNKISIKIILLLDRRNIKYTFSFATSQESTGMQWDSRQRNPQTQRKVKSRTKFGKAENRWKSPKSPDTAEKVETQVQSKTPGHTAASHTFSEEPTEFLYCKASPLLKWHSAIFNYLWNGNSSLLTIWWWPCGRGFQFVGFFFFYIFIYLSIISCSNKEKNDTDWVE